MTEVDFFELARRHWPLPPNDDPWQEYQAGRLNHFDALAHIYARIRTSEEHLRRVVLEMGLDPGLAAAVRTLRAKGWETWIASAGCEWYIRVLLEPLGLPLRIHSNPGVFDPERGLVLQLPVASPFFSRPTGIDKPGIVRAALATGKPVAFAGDGRPDLDAALLVPAGCRFARGFLADHFRAQGEAFVPLPRWSHLAERLPELPST